MRSLLVTGLSAAAMTFAAACASPGGGFQSDVKQALNAPIGVIQIEVADDLVGSPTASRRISGNNTIGPEDAQDVSEMLSDELERALTASGAYQPQVGQPVATLKATITQVTPNRLEFTERGRKDSTLSTGIGRGGATIEAVLISPEGVEIGTFAYKRYAATLSEAASRAGTWADAERTFSVFADQIAASVSTSSPSL